MKVGRPWKNFRRRSHMQSVVLRFGVDAHFIRVNYVTPSAFG